MMVMMTATTTPGTRTFPLHACRLVTFADILGGRVLLSGGDVEAILRTQGYDDGEEVVRDAGLCATSSAPAGFWVLALGAKYAGDGQEPD